MFEEFPFFTSYKHYIQIEVSAKTQEVFNNWYGFVESQIRRFTRTIEGNKSIMIRIYPTSFDVVGVRRGDDAQPDTPLCKQFYIAFKPLESAKGRPLDLSLATKLFKTHLQRVGERRGVEGRNARGRRAT